jgi:hypothetical protein
MTATVEAAHVGVAPDNWRTFWAGFLGRLQRTDPFLATMLQDAEHVACPAPNRLVATVAGLYYSSCKSYAEHAKSRVDEAARETAGRPVTLTIEQGSPPPAAALPESSQQLRREAQDDPLVRRLEQVLGASVLHVERIPVRTAAAAEPSGGESESTADEEAAREENEP